MPPPPRKGETEPPQKCTTHTTPQPGQAAAPHLAPLRGSGTNVERGSETKDCLVCARKALRTPRHPKPRQESTTNDSAPLSKPRFPLSSRVHSRRGGARFVGGGSWIVGARRWKVASLREGPLRLDLHLE
ncbi:hypothetical protein Taro_007864, partial [Colocasia esculenta]|nr:hypothetical protein [Colocasia esculenta]